MDIMKLLRRIFFAAYVVLTYIVPIYLIVASSSIEYREINVWDAKIWVFIALFVYFIFFARKFARYMEKSPIGLGKIIFESLQYIMVIGLIYLVVSFMESAFAGGTDALFKALIFVVMGVTCRIIDWFWNGETILENERIRRAKEELKFEATKERVRNDII